MSNETGDDRRNVWGDDGRNHDRLPAAQLVVDAFVERGDIVGIGPFADGGNMAIFRSREAAEAFAENDPFIVEGLISSVVIRAWRDTMLS